MVDWAKRFHHHFIAELHRDGFVPRDMLQWLWRPHGLDELNVLGHGRDTDLSKLTLTETDIQSILNTVPPSPVDINFYRRQKLALILVPGFTHETLRKLTLHEQIEDKQSPHHIVMLRPGRSECVTEETTYASGSGLKIAYACYPRSNAASDNIIAPLFSLLHHSASLRQWANDGYRFCFVGYSYGAPLSLELLAAMHSGQFTDDFMVKNTCSFLSLCGDIGGSWLADDVVSDNPSLINIAKVVAFARKYPLLGKLIGLGAEQLRDDMLAGVTSLGHAVRQAKLADYGPQLPTHVDYFTISAVMPMADYQRHWRQLNLDDYTMWRQAKVSQPISLYNDGQVTLDDHQLPALAHLPADKNTYLGAVRTHHWGVSYKTFNFGNNRFPRPAFYRALLHTLCEKLGMV